MEQVDIWMVKGDDIIGNIKGSIEWTITRDSVGNNKEMVVKSVGGARALVYDNFSEVFDIDDFTPEKNLFDIIIERGKQETKIENLYLYSKAYICYYCGKHLIIENFEFKSF